MRALHPVEHFPTIVFNYIFSFEVFCSFAKDISWIYSFTFSLTFLTHGFSNRFALSRTGINKFSFLGLVLKSYWRGLSVQLRGQKAEHISSLKSPMLKCLFETNASGLNRWHGTVHCWYFPEITFWGQVEHLRNLIKGNHSLKQMLPA